MTTLKLKSNYLKIFFVFFLSFLCACAQTVTPTRALQLDKFQGMQSTATAKRYGLVIHGGAGTIKRENLSPRKETEIREKLSEALAAGYKVLDNGGASLDAVTAAIVILEDSPLFNAGKGAVFTTDKKHELDASLMNGKDLNAGASTNFRLQQIEKALENEKTSITKSYEVDDIDIFAHDPHHKFGTVGAVAIDKNGNLAAGTSTGGMTNKRFGRIGDSPIIGAGTYADNRSCGVSATGHGEYFIRYAVAHDVCARMLHGGKSLKVAADEVINQDLVKAGGDGGIIAVDKEGNYAFTFNTAGMYRGIKFSDGELETGIFKTN